MLKSEVGYLAEKCNVSKTTIYRIAEMIELNLRPFYGRCDKTVDCFSGETLDGEHSTWLEVAAEKINSYRKQKAKLRESKRS